MNKESGQKQRILYLDYLRAIAIITISLNHAVNRAFAVQEGQAAETAVLPLYLNVIKTGAAVFSRIGVPLFLMITGSLMLTREYKTKKDICRFYKSNWLKLFVTAEIWFFIIEILVRVVAAFSDFWNPALLMLFYAVVSVGGSILFIKILSKNSFCKKYMFMIKP